MANASAGWCRGGIGGLKFQFPDRGKDVSRWAAGRSAAQHAITQVPTQAESLLSDCDKKDYYGGGIRASRVRKRKSFPSR